MKKITARKLRCLELAKTVPYTYEDYASLLNILAEYAKTKAAGFCWAGSSEAILLDLYCRVGNFMHLGSYPLGIRFGWIPKYKEVPKYLHTKNLNFFQYLLTFNRKVFLFMACVPLNKVPLYFETPVIKVFAQWRMQIQK